MPDPEPAVDERLRVVVVDADDRTRESLSSLLAIGDRVTVVGSAGHPGTALDLVTRARPDVVIVDPRLPEVDGGIAFMASLRTYAPDVRILAMAWSDSLERAALDGGADGFIRKTFRSSELVAAVLAMTRHPAA
jgi:two-component system, NarL family, response regulator DevR